MFFSLPSKNEAARRLGAPSLLGSPADVRIAGMSVVPAARGGSPRPKGMAIPGPPERGEPEARGNGNYGEHSAGGSIAAQTAGWTTSREQAGRGRCPCALPPARCRVQAGTRLHSASADSSECRGPVRECSRSARRGMGGRGRTAGAGNSGSSSEMEMVRSRGHQHGGDVRGCARRSGMPRNGPPGVPPATRACHTSQRRMAMPNRGGISCAALCCHAAG